MKIALCDAVEAFSQVRLGIREEEIGTHSIKSGSAMAMYLGQCPVKLIMMIGQWSSYAFLVYIRKQFQLFSHDVSSKMLCFHSHCLIPDKETRNSRYNPRQCSQSDLAVTKKNIICNMAQQVRVTAFPSQC